MFWNSIIEQVFGIVKRESGYVLDFSLDSIRGLSGSHGVKLNQSLSEYHETTLVSLAYEIYSR
jgi:hypothetical protein